MRNKRWIVLILAMAVMAVFQHRGIAAVTLRVTAENPSELRSREITVKSLLPRPVGPEHVQDADGMDIIYDEAAGQYAVRKDVVLEPGASQAFTIVLEDVWVISDAILDAYEKRASDLSERLAEEDYAVEAEMLYEEIKKNIEVIRTKQAASAVPDVSPAEHIGAYNQNKARLEEVEEDLGKLRALLAILSDRLMLERVPKGPSPNLGTIWMVVFIIITFVGVMSGIFFFIWSVQLQKVRKAEQVEAKAGPSE